MAKAKRPISKNSSAAESPPIPESAPTPTSSTPTGAPDALTLDEVLEQMLPHCDDDPFEVAEWLEAHTRKKEGVRLLADGIGVTPHLCKTHLGVVAKIASDGRATLEVQLLSRSFGHVEKTEVIVGHEKPDRGFDIFDGINSLKPIKQGGEEVRPIERWTVERKSFEANRPDAPRNRGGRPPKYNRERILTEALIYSAVSGWPDTLDGVGGAFEKLEARLKPNQIPERTTLFEIFSPIQKRIDDEREKSKKKPVR
jgi:hypothetical protein